MKMNRVALVSSAQVELRPSWSGAQHIDLISAVVSSVFKGVGLTLDDVDFIIDSGSDVLDGRSISNCGFLGAMGAHHKEESRVEEDGLWAASYAANKIAAGAGDVGLVIAYSKPSESDVEVFYSIQCEPFYQRPVGFGHFAASGIQAQRYMSTHGVTSEDLARLVAKRWSDAEKNGRVQIGDMPTEADIVNADNIATPLTEKMMSRPVDGAVAMLVVSEEVARRISQNPVWITGMGNSADRHAFASRTAGTLESCEVAAKAAYKMAGWDTPKPSIAEVSGSSAVTECMVIEALGLAPKGGAIGALEGTDTQINLSGGALPADPIMATGLVRLSEAFRQLTTPGLYGLEAPTSAVVHGAGGVGMQTHCVFTLEI